ncbi:hypothetical protein [Sphingomonas prati]|uniref:DUF1330 domain-containing protein n=1 Tax=Sphingomonas prati TaxID=1843237 RepID=A0A7W9BRZ6_9SPHN|nr:hypothetical protein [Sphingomonas prati]MBB5729067.1 hypothetical protein [Sphingomonas prati]GGE85354.1 hypothetical protein GCM10011404_17660 [Sphingomonas prati]
MKTNLELDETVLDDAARAIGDGPVVMVNLLRFRAQAHYPADFVDPKPDARSGYYEGYVGGFRQACAALGITPELLYAGARSATLLGEQDDDWDEIAVVRYARFDDLRRILTSETYNRCAKPHRLAVLRDWRFIATRTR